MNEKATTLLTQHLLEQVRAHYLVQPTGRAAVYEALNALAAASAMVLLGTEQDCDTMRAWFDRALNRNLVHRPDPGAEQVSH